MTAVTDPPVEQWAIDKLIPYEKNHKKHSDAQVKALAASILELGVENPIAIEEDGTIISGHGRRLALIQAGRTYAPVRVFRGLSKAQANKLRIAANKTTSNEWDTDALQSELRSILSDGMTLDGLGLSEKEEKLLLDDIGEVDLGAMSDDITGDVEKHEEGVKEAAKKADEESVSLAKIFGFKEVQADHARVIKRYLGVVEDRYGSSALDAMIAHMQEVVDAA